MKNLFKGCFGPILIMFMIVGVLLVGTALLLNQAVTLNM